MNTSITKKRVINELKAILIELAHEFMEQQPKYITEHKLGRALKVGIYASFGKKRGDASQSYEQGVILDRHALYQQFTYMISKFASGKKLHDFIVEKNMWHDEIEPLEGSTMTIPNMVGRVGGGFLCRIFELNQNPFVVTTEAFEQAFNELVTYFSKDYISSQYYYHLKGVGGEIDSIKLTDNVSIVRAGFERAKFFSINYQMSGYHDVEVFEDDYLLEIKFKLQKSTYAKGSYPYTIKNTEAEKWKLFLRLIIPGYVRVGKEIHLSDDWISEYNFAPGPYGEESREWSAFKLVLTSTEVANYAHTAARLQSIKTIKDLNKKILYSLERLAKSKAASQIDDRVVELALAFEYLINTTDRDVTLQLCLKLINLCDESPNDNAYSQLKAFYSLRSKVMHGVDKILANDKNVAIIEFTERYVQCGILRFIELTTNYTYKQVDEQLTRTMYRKESLDTLLRQITDK